MKVPIRVATQVFMATVWLALAATMLVRHRLLIGLLALALGLGHAGITYRRLHPKGHQTTHHPPKR